jgi:hypothetical protein
MAMKRIMHYLQETPDYGLLLHRSSSSDLVVYTDADWADCPDTRRSTSGYVVFLGDNLVSWSAKWQTVVSCPSVEAKYHAVANGVAEATWLRQHQCTKHVEIDLNFVREKIAISQVRVLHVPTISQFTDIFTKGLPFSVFNEFRSSLNICSG